MALSQGSFERDWIEGDEAFYYLHRDGELIGAVITHVDDFTLAGTKDFIKEVLETVAKNSLSPR